MCIFRSIGLGHEGTESHRCFPKGRTAGCLWRRQNKRLHRRFRSSLLSGGLAMPHLLAWQLWNKGLVLVQGGSWVQGMKDT